MMDFFCDRRSISLILKSSSDMVKNLYRLDGLSTLEDTIAVLDKAVNRWRTITSPLYDSTRPNSLTRVLDLEAKKYEEMQFERYSFSLDTVFRGQHSLQIIYVVKSIFAVFV